MISAAEWLRVCLRPPWSLRFCDAMFVPGQKRRFPSRVFLCPQSPRAKFLQNVCKRSAKDVVKFWRKFSQIFVLRFPGKIREGVNREKLTVKKPSITRFFFSPFMTYFMSLINREKLCVNREKLCVNREQIGTKNPPFFHR